MEAPIPGSYWLHRDLLAGRHPEERVAQLLEAGITFFLDLTEAGELPPYGHVLPAGVEYRRMPIRDFSVPSREEMAAILDEVARRAAEGHKIYLHCHGGLGRTGTVVGCHLVQLGMDGATALQEIPRLRESGGCEPARSSPETEAQRAMVRTWRSSVQTGGDEPGGAQEVGKHGLDSGLASKAVR